MQRDPLEAGHYPCLVGALLQPVGAERSALVDREAQLDVGRLAQPFGGEDLP